MVENTNAGVSIAYSLWMKALGCIGLPVLLGVAIYVASMPLWDNELTRLQQIFLPLLGAFVAFQCCIGFFCLADLNTVVWIDDDGIQLQRGDQTKRYAWSDFHVKSYPLASAIRIVSSDGNSIAWFSDDLANVALLESMALKSDGQ